MEEFALSFEISFEFFGSLFDFFEFLRGLGVFLAVITIDRVKLGTGLVTAPVVHWLESISLRIFFDSLLLWRVLDVGLPDIGIKWSSLLSVRGGFNVWVKCLAGLETISVSLESGAVLGLFAIHLYRSGYVVWSLFLFPFHLRLGVCFIVLLGNNLLAGLGLFFPIRGNWFLFGLWEILFGLTVEKVSVCLVAFVGDEGEDEENQEIEVVDVK